MYKMPAAHHADQYWGRWAVSETASRSVHGKICREQELLWDVQLVQLKTRWVLSTQTSLHTLTFCCFPVLHLLFLIRKRLWAISILCFSNAQTRAAKECDSSILQLHHKSWIIITPRTWVSVTAAAQWAFLSYFFFIPPWTEILTSAGQKYKPNI